MTFEATPTIGTLGNPEKIIEKKFTSEECFGTIDKAKYKKSLEENIKAIEEQLERKIDPREDATIYMDAQVNALKDSQIFSKENGVETGSLSEPEVKFLYDIHAKLANKLDLQNYEDLEAFSAVGTELEQGQGISAIVELKKGGDVERLFIKGIYPKKSYPEATYAKEPAFFNEQFKSTYDPDGVKTRIPQDGIDYSNTEDGDNKLGDKLTTETAEILASQFEKEK